MIIHRMLFLKKIRFLLNSLINWMFSVFSYNLRSYMDKDLKFQHFRNDQKREVTHLQDRLVDCQVQEIVQRLTRIFVWREPFSVESSDEICQYGMENIDGYGRIPLADGYEEWFFRNGRLEGLWKIVYRPHRENERKYEGLFQNGLLISGTIRYGNGDVKKWDFIPGTDRLQGEWMQVKMRKNPKQPNIWIPSVRKEGMFEDDLLVAGFHTNPQSGITIQVSDHMLRQIMRYGKSVLLYSWSFLEVIHALHKREPQIVTDNHRHFANRIFSRDGDVLLEDFYEWRISLEHLEEYFGAVQQEIEFLLADILGNCELFEDEKKIIDELRRNLELLRAVYL